MSTLRAIIEGAFEERQSLSPASVSIELSTALQEVLQALNLGAVRVAEKINGEWQTNEWLKKAILLYFQVTPSDVIDANYVHFFDKVPLRFTHKSDDGFQKLGIRVVPQAIVREGAHVGPQTILMPSFTNIGAYIGSGTMVDTWATVGSCAQIGKNVHLSGGVGIGGVLEPLQAHPTIIEDNCFIGARSEIVEGVIVEEGSVISMGVFIGQSTRIYDRETGEISYGRVPAGSVVVSGNLPSKDGSHSLYCAVIVKKVDAQTRGKVSLNELLRL